MKTGWKALLANPWFVQHLKEVTLFVASHHGRENGSCEEILDLSPNIQTVIISDKKKGFQSQETVDRYRSDFSQESGKADVGQYVARSSAMLDQPAWSDGLRSLPLTLRL